MCEVIKRKARLFLLFLYACASIEFEWSRIAFQALRAAHFRWWRDVTHGAAVGDGGGKTHLADLLASRVEFFTRLETREIETFCQSRVSTRLFWRYSRLYCPTLGPYFWHAKIVKKWPKVQISIFGIFLKLFLHFKAFAMLQIAMFMIGRTLFWTISLHKVGV